MKYKNYRIADGRLIKEGDSRDTTKGFNLNEVKSIEKKRISKRQLLMLGVLSLVLVWALSGALASPMMELVALGSFLLIVSTVASVFTTDRYVVKTRNEHIVIPAKGSKGGEFMREVHRSTPVQTDSELSYGDDADPFVNSARQKQMNLAMLGMIVIGSVLAVGFVAPMYSDNVGWDEVTEIVEVMGEDNPGDISGAEDFERVYETEDQVSTGEVFESEFATVEFSQGEADLDDIDSSPETYVNIDLTVHHEALLGISVEIPEEQIDANRPFATVVDEDENWAWYDVNGEIEVDVGDTGQTTTQVIPTGTDEHIGVTQSLNYRADLFVRDDTELEEEETRFVKGANIDDDIPGPDEVDGIEDIEEPDPTEVVGFDEGDTIRVTGTLPETVDDNELLEIVLAEYTVE